MTKWIAVLLATFSLSACDSLAVMFTAPKKPQASHTALSQQAEQHFWNTLHQGNYAAIPSTESLLTTAYIENPNDPVLAAHLGFLHIWKITERQREQVNSPLMVNQIVLAKKYFKDAVELNPQDARYLGFLGDSQLAEGQIFNDDREQTRGYFTLKKAIHQWPEFNLFTAGYIMSTLPADSSFFKEGLAWQWQTLDLCARTRVNRANPDFSSYMQYETQQSPKRACWNSWIAPYNFEGFFMNMGDMLVKSGDWQTAQKIYRNAMLAKNYSTWPYKTMLENRIKNAEANVKNFRVEIKNPAQAKPATPDQAILFNSGRGCVACHQH